MRVIKMRGSEHETHPYRLAIEPGGLKVDEDDGRRGGGSAAAAPLVPSDTLTGHPFTPLHTG